MKKFTLKPLFMVCLVVLLTNCQRDETLNENISQEASFQLAQKSFDEFGALPKLYETVISPRKKAVLNRQESNKDGTNSGGLYDFTVVKSNVLEYTNANGVYYTMQVIRPNQSPDYFENLIIVNNHDEDPRAFLFRYVPDQQYIANVQNNPFAEFTGETYSRELNYENIASGTTSRGQECFSWTTTHCDYGGEEHDAGANCTPAFMYTKTHTVCYPVTEGIEDTDDSDGSAGTGTGWTPSGGGPNGGNSGGSTSNNNNNDDDSGGMTGPVFNVDLLYSIKSPFNLNFDGVDLNTPEGIQFKCIYDKLVESPDFKNFFIDTFNNNDNKINANFIVGPIAPRENGITPNGTVSNLKILRDQNGAIVKTGMDITINEDILKNPSKKSSISVAKTILHEAIHAYIFVKAVDCNQGVNLGTLETIDTASLINNFFNIWPCGSQNFNVDQHEFMFDNLLPAMTKILNHLKDALISGHHQSLVSDLSFTDPETNVDENWNWDRFFHALSLTGLHETLSFSDHVQNESNSYWYNHYSAYHNAFSKDCN